MLMYGVLLLISLDHISLLNAWLVIFIGIFLMKGNLCCWKIFNYCWGILCGLCKMVLQHISVLPHGSVRVQITPIVGSRSLDMKPRDFLLWRHAKSIVHTIPNVDVNDLRNRIVDSFNSIRNTLRVFKRVRQKWL